jgi:predicted Zn-dependent peptidase
MNDGYLILTGDIDEPVLKKLLLQYAGNFNVTDKAFPRTVVRYQPISGVSTNTFEGDVNCMDMVLSAPVPLTSRNYYLAEVASMVLKKCIARAIVGMGMYPRMAHECRIYPQERFNVLLSLSEASADGFAKGTVHEDPLQALETVRSVLSDMQSLEFSDAELAVYKASLKQRVELKKADPAYWLSIISRRYIDGKDLFTDYASEIDSITRKDVIALLTSLSKGSRVEYIITGK